MDQHTQRKPAAAATAGTAESFVESGIEYRRVTLPHIELTWAVYAGTDGGVLVDKADGRGLSRPALTVNEGYLMISLRRTDGRLVQPRVHQLVARAFLGDPPSATHVVDHIDGIPSHNEIRNLRWASPSVNRQNRTRHMRAANPQTRGRVRRIPISAGLAVEVRRRTTLRGKQLYAWVERAIEQQLAQQPEQ